MYTGAKKVAAPRLEDRAVPSPLGASFLFGAFKYLTKRFLPYQTPKRVGKPGTKQPARNGLYQQLFKWLVQSRRQIDGLLGGRAYLSGSTGSSNWPTMTGREEYSFESCWYQGGRDVQIGDMVVINHPTKKDSLGRPMLLNKRIVGFAGHSSFRRLGYLGRWSRVIV